MLSNWSKPYAGALSVLSVLSALSCDSKETGPDDHTPVSYQLLIGGTLRAVPYSFTSGQTVRVQLRFFNAANEDLDDVESSHYALLSFNPAALATITPVAGHHYQFDVTPGAVATGTVVVSFGHDAEADETAFPAVAVAVVAP